MSNDEKRKGTCRTIKSTWKGEKTQQKRCALLLPPEVTKQNQERFGVLAYGVCLSFLPNAYGISGF